MISLNQHVQHTVEVRLILSMYVRPPGDDAMLSMLQAMIPSADWSILADQSELLRMAVVVMSDSGREEGPSPWSIPMMVINLKRYKN